MASLEELSIKDDPVEKTVLEEIIDEANELCTESKMNESATIIIAQDSSHISLSACNYDHLLLNYLKNHPLTKE